MNMNQGVCILYEAVNLFNVESSVLLFDQIMYTNL